MKENQYEYKVKIVNFKSIQSIELTLSSNKANYLIGKNETGKSNIIKVINFLGTYIRNGDFYAKFKI